MLIQPLVLGFLLAPSPAPAPEPTKDWLDLDMEIESLASTALGMGSPVQIEARLIASYFVSRDPILYTGSPEHASGVQLRSARLGFTGGNEDWNWRLSGDGADGTLDLVDAWLSRSLSASTEVKLGKFKRPVLQSAMVSRKHILFWERSNNGAQTKVRDWGGMLTGHYGQLHAFLSLMNGSRGELGTNANYFASGRLEYDMIGEPFDQYEGAYGAAEGMHLGIAGVAGEDGGVEDGIFAGYEFELVSGGFFLGADFMTYDDGYDLLGGLPAGTDPDVLFGTNLAGSSPFTVTSSLLFGGNRFEIAGRLEVFDDLADSSRTSFSFSIFDEVLGPRKRIMIDYADVTSDDDSLEGDKVEIGLILYAGGD